MKIEIVLGTRPEIIKMAPIIRECRNSKDIEIRIVHTGQHYDINMSQEFFSDLKIPFPDLNFNVGSGTHGYQIGKALMELEKDFLGYRPDVVLAEGDTNAVLSASLAAVKIGIKFGHVEAGLRSYDKTMPEEINRIIADHCADYCFAPSEIAKAELLKDGISDQAIFLTGNTIVDACLQHVGIAFSESKIMNDLNLQNGKYAIATLHRANNVDNLSRVSAIIRALNRLDLLVVFPLHPRTKLILERSRIQLNSNILISQPLGYLDFLRILASSRLVITDSGGIQEESSVLQVPCITVRDNTERPETIAAGVNVLVGADENKIVKIANDLIRDDSVWQIMRGKPNLYGDGKAAHKIVQILSRSIK